MQLQRGEARSAGCGRGSRFSQFWVLCCPTGWHEVTFRRELVLSLVVSGSCDILRGRKKAKLGLQGGFVFFVVVVEFASSTELVDTAIQQRE